MVLQHAKLMSLNFSSGVISFLSAALSPDSSFCCVDPAHVEILSPIAPRLVLFSCFQCHEKDAGICVSFDLLNVSDILSDGPQVG